MSRFLLHNRHDPSECGVTYAAFKGYSTPLRRRPTASSCLPGGHEIWWVVDAEDAPAALAMLPHYVAERSTVIPIREVLIP